MDLLSRADGYQYYSFADQDDVWDLDKLHIGISYLRMIIIYMAVQKE